MASSNKQQQHTRSRKRNERLGSSPVFLIPLESCMELNNVSTTGTNMRCEHDEKNTEASAPVGEASADNEETQLLCSAGFQASCRVGFQAHAFLQI